MSDLLASLQSSLPDATTSRNRYASVPGTQVRLLTQTSKMPGPSWSLPAQKACPRANGTICDGCYAVKGCYRYSTTRNAQHVRFTWTLESMRTPAGCHQWIAHMVSAIRGSGCKYFRVHDSGDLFSVTYAQCWLEICQQLARVKFWIPTRAWQQPAGLLPILDPLLETLRQLAGLNNVAVRPSALNFGDSAPIVAGLHAGSTADMTDPFRARECPAYRQGGQCANCRACWNAKTTAVSYRRH
jgi:hypothetical protein